MPDQVAALRSGAIDVGVLRPPVNDPDLTVRPLHDDRLVVAVPADQPLGARARGGRGICATWTSSSTRGTRRSMMYAATFRLFRELAVESRVRHEVDETSILIRLVAGGLGAAVVPEPVTPSPTPASPTGPSSIQSARSASPWHTAPIAPSRISLVPLVSSPRRLRKSDRGGPPRGHQCPLPRGREQHRDAYTGPPAPTMMSSNSTGNGRTSATWICMSRRSLGLRPPRPSANGSASSAMCRRRMHPDGDAGARRFSRVAARARRHRRRPGGARRCRRLPGRPGHGQKRVPGAVGREGDAVRRRSRRGKRGRRIHQRTRRLRARRDGPQPAPSSVVSRSRPRISRCPSALTPLAITTATCPTRPPSRTFWVSASSHT